MSTEQIIPDYNDYFEPRSPYLRELFRADSFQLYRKATDRLDNLSRSKHLGVRGLSELRDIEAQLQRAENLADNGPLESTSLPLRIRTARHLAPLRARTGSLIDQRGDSRQLAAYETLILRPAYQQLIDTAETTLGRYAELDDEEAIADYRGMIQEQTIYGLGLRPADARHFIVPASAQQDYMEDFVRFDALAINSRRTGGDIRRAIQVRTRPSIHNRGKDRQYARARHATVIYGSQDMHNVAGANAWQGSDYQSQPFPTLQAMIDEAQGQASSEVSSTLDVITANLQRRIFSK